MTDFWGMKPNRKRKKSKRVRTKPWNPLTTVRVKKKNMNWTIAKAKYPKLKPFGDADKDKVPNWMDCRPFDRRKHMVSVVGTRKWYAQKRREGLSSDEQEKEIIKAVQRKEKAVGEVPYYHIKEIKRRKVPFVKSRNPEEDSVIIYDPEKVTKREVKIGKKEMRERQRKWNEMSPEERADHDRKQGEYFDFPEEEIEGFVEERRESGDYDE